MFLLLFLLFLVTCGAGVVVGAARRQHGGSVAVFHCSRRIFARRRDAVVTVGEQERHLAVFHVDFGVFGVVVVFVGVVIVVVVALPTAAATVGVIETPLCGNIARETVSDSSFKLFFQSLDSAPNGVSRKTSQGMVAIGIYLHIHVARYLSYILSNRINIIRIMLIK